MKVGKMRSAAIVLAAGKGSRMGTSVQKQYLEIDGKPVLYYSLEVFERSDVIDEVVLVVGEGQKGYCEQEIVRKYGFKKVSQVIHGGKERYDSVYLGLKSLEDGNIDYVFIHDGARPFVDEDMIMRAFESVQRCRACVVGMPSKDTIKRVDGHNVVVETPDRACLWQVQTPQVFEYFLIKEAYYKLMEKEDICVTDDAMVLERMKGIPVILVEGSYENIKITTPEDLYVAEAFLKKREKIKKCIDISKLEC